MIRWVLSCMLALGGAVQAQGLRDCATCPEMVSLPPGDFTMGPATGEEDREGVPQANRDGPTHRVRIGYSFALGKHEVTRGEFAAFVKDAGWETGTSCWGIVTDGFADTPGRTWRDPGFAQSDRDPVVCVNWEDAKAYVAWLRRTTGKGYRLPSEAEWEYAARAGSQASRYWGNSRDSACRYGNFADLTAASTLNWERKPEIVFLCSDGHVYTAPVGRFQPNAFGLHDMLGNVLEWTEDCRMLTYDGAPLDGSAWIAGNCNRRMLRGGSWNHDPWIARAATRTNGLVRARSTIAGLRVARTD